MRELKRRRLAAAGPPVQPEAISLTFPGLPRSGRLSPSRPI